MFNYHPFIYKNLWTEFCHDLNILNEIRNKSVKASILFLLYIYSLATNNLKQYFNLDSDQLPEISFYQVIFIIFNTGRFFLPPLFQVNDLDPHLCMLISYNLKIFLLLDSIRNTTKHFIVIKSDFKVITVSQL